jgi:transcriptional repressor of cell division inhibition gene dicB
MLIVLGMLKSDVLAHYKTNVAVAQALGISEAAVSQWSELIPPAKARELSQITEGRLSFDPALYNQSSPQVRRLAEALSVVS